jgi:biopolymer transport protein ExbD
MRLNKHRRPLGASMDMTPMIDVVFQLIIFFMTVSQQAYVNITELELPKLKGAYEKQETTININITHDGRYLVSGDVRSLAELRSMVAKELEAAEGNAALVKVVLRVDRRGASAATNQAMLMLQQTGIKRTRIAVEASASQ